MTHSAAPVEPRPPAPEPAPLPLTVTHLLEHLYCPRFTYFEHVLAVPERQERRLLVQKGRQAHEERKKINPSYLRKKLGVVERKFDVPLTSPKLGVRGAVDEVLTLADGSMAPFDYKFAEFRDRIYHNQKMQSVALRPTHPRRVRPPRPPRLPVLHPLQAQGGANRVHRL